jgi:poly(3-hydroxybutyrate) depolymerase
MRGKGRRIRDAAIAHLLQHAGLAGADEVVVSGTSAGGLAVYLNIDQIAAQLPATATVRGLVGGVPQRPCCFAPPSCVFILGEMGLHCSKTREYSMMMMMTMMMILLLCMQRL